MNQLENIAAENAVLEWFQTNKESMLIKRILVIIILMPLWIFSIFKGGFLLAAVMAVVMSIAVWEYGSIFRSGGYQPADITLFIGAIGFTTLHAWVGEEWDMPLLVFLILSSMGFHLLAYERGRDKASIDLLVTMGGIVYIGLFGSYFVTIRALPDGEWWMLIVLSAVWWGDTGGYVVGKVIGRRKFAPRLSPKKTWEGYIGGVFCGIVGTPSLILLYRKWGLGIDSEITIQRALIIGVMISFLATLGDLGISMFKRYANKKDSGAILPGHGGILDRIDSWIWGILIGYYLIKLIFLK